MLGIVGLIPLRHSELIDISSSQKCCFKKEDTGILSSSRKLLKKKKSIDNYRDLKTYILSFLKVLEQTPAA